VVPPLVTLAGARPNVCPLVTSSSWSLPVELKLVPGGPFRMMSPLPGTSVPVADAVKPTV
jgi:hypothetical protein